MPRTASNDQSPWVPLHARRSHGLDVSWVRDAKCAPHQRDVNSPWHQAWLVDKRGKIVKLPDGTLMKSDTMMDVALEWCRSCPVQWQCATFAVAGDERHLIWAVDPEHLRWLQRPGFDALTFIEQARNRGELIQDAVARVSQVTIRTRRVRSRSARLVG